MLFTEFGGASHVGEVWFTVANAPEGPWRPAQKVATHAKPGRNYDFYNPVQHASVMRQNGRYVYFEGTFVNTFSGTPTPVPYYNYNQLLYRLDVDDPRLGLPEPPAGWSGAKPSRLGP
jgi:hypothetical protein